MSSPEDALLGRIALHYKLVTPETLKAALERQPLIQPPKRIGEILLDMKVISADQLKWLLTAQQQYLAKQGGAAAAPGQPAAPVPAPSAPRAQGHVVNLPTAPNPAAIPSAKASADRKSVV